MIIVRGWMMRLAESVSQLENPSCIPRSKMLPCCCLHKRMPCTFLPEGICSCCPFYQKRSYPNIWMAYSFTSFSPLFKYLLLSGLSRPSYLKLQPSWNSLLPASALFYFIALITISHSKYFAYLFIDYFFQLEYNIYEVRDFCLFCSLFLSPMPGT